MSSVSLQRSNPKHGKRSHTMEEPYRGCFVDCCCSQWTAGQSIRKVCKYSFMEYISSALGSIITIRFFFSCLNVEKKKQKTVHLESHDELRKLFSGALGKVNRTYQPEKTEKERRMLPRTDAKILLTVLYCEVQKQEKKNNFLF